MADITPFSPEIEPPVQQVAEPASRPRLEADSKSARDYAYESLKLHQSQIKGVQPPALLKILGDGELAVGPTNRLDAAIGLTVGLGLGGTLAKVATGYALDGSMVNRAEVPTFLQGMHKIVKNYDPKGLDSRNRWIKYVQWGAYSLGGLLGVKAGTDYAYRKVKENNKDPHYLEDYLSRVSMQQGETWSWLAAFSGIFGSAAGLFVVPVVPTNYGLGMAGRTTSMQDRNIMIPGVNKALSGASTSSYLRLKEGMSYLSQYAAGNPGQDLAQTEYLGYTMLEPIFGKQLTARHLEQFTDALNEVRDPYWQEGGIPKDKRKEAVKTVKEVFSGAGLELLLINMGLNPGTVEFGKINGLVGKIGNMGGVSKKVHEEQERFLKALQERLPVYVQDGKLSQERADWVVAGIEATRKHSELPPFPENDSLVQETEKDKELPVAARKDIKPKESINRLVKAAQQDTGDWRETTLRQKQSRRNVPMAVE